MIAAGDFGDDSGDFVDDLRKDLCHDCGAVLFLFHPSFQKLFSFGQRQRLNLIK